MGSAPMSTRWPASSTASRTLTFHGVDCPSKMAATTSVPAAFHRPVHNIIFIFFK